MKIYVVKAWNNMTDRQLDYRLCRNILRLIMTAVLFMHKYNYIRIEKRYLGR